MLKEKWVLKASATKPPTDKPSDIISSLYSPVGPGLCPGELLSIPGASGVFLAGDPETTNFSSTVDGKLVL